MTPTAPRRPPLGGGTYPWRGEDHRTKTPVSYGPPPRGTPKLSPLVYGGATQAWAGQPFDDATRKLFLNCLALLSGAAGLIHLAAAVPHYEESALHGAFFVGTGLAQLAGAGLLMAWPRKPVLVATACVNALIVALWLMSRTAGLPAEPHPWTPEPVGIADSVASLLEVGLVIGSALLLAPSSALLVGQARPREPKWWLAGAASVTVLLTALAVPSAARPGAHSHTSTSEGSSESEASTSRATRSVGGAEASRPDSIGQTTKAVTAPAVEPSPAPVYQPPAPTTVRNPAPVYQPPPAVVVPEPPPVYQPPAPEVDQPPPNTGGETGHTHEGGEHHEHAG
jgi:hypothetical protein